MSISDLGRHRLVRNALSFACIYNVRFPFLSLNGKHTGQLLLKDTHTVCSPGKCQVKNKKANYMQCMNLVHVNSFLFEI